MTIHQALLRITFLKVFLNSFVCSVSMLEQVAGVGKLPARHCLRKGLPMLHTMSEVSFSMRELLSLSSVKLSDVPLAAISQRPAAQARTLLAVSSPIVSRDDTLAWPKLGTFLIEMPRPYTDRSPRSILSSTFCRLRLMTLSTLNTGRLSNPSQVLALGPGSNCWTTVRV